MALLTQKQRETRFRYLGLGDYNKENILKFQKKAFTDKSQHDGVYGVNTDRALRHFYNVKKVTKNFEPEEFRCNCGHCTGYPTFMKQVELKLLQAIRDHFGKPMIVTSGLRCKTENARVGGVVNSGHLKGYACDFYMKGVTETPAQRTEALAWIKKQPDHEFTYGANMKDSNGLYRSAASMGNAMHVETHKHVETIFDRMTSWAKKIAADNRYHYNKWDQNVKQSQLCPICSKLDYNKDQKHFGWNCIGFTAAVWHHGGGLSNICKCGWISGPHGTGDKLLAVKTDAEALQLARKYTGLKDIQVIRNKNGIPKSQWKEGDICLRFYGDVFDHAFYYAGDGTIIDSTGSNGKVPNDQQIAIRSAGSGYHAKVIIRYIGK